MLLSYLDRQLSPDSMEAMDRHVALCADCTRMVEAQRAVWRALDQWEPIAVSADFDDRVMARIAADAGRRSWWLRALEFPLSFGWWKPAMPLAAACVALLAVAVWRGPSMPDYSPTAATTTMDSSEAQQLEDALADVDMLHQLGVTSEAQTSL